MTATTAEGPEFLDSLRSTPCHASHACSTRTRFTTSSRVVAIGRQHAVLATVKCGALIDWRESIAERRVSGIVGEIRSTPVPNPPVFADVWGGADRLPRGAQSKLWRAGRSFHRKDAGYLQRWHPAEHQ